jgi:thioesterase domain-containing protein/acyl carrier protein
LEGRLVEIWEDVMNIHPIGVMDNFFELGGHSLLAVRLFSAIEKELNIKLPLAAFFESATIANQAKAIHEQVSEDRPILVGVETGGEKPPFFCVSPTIIDVMTYIELSKNMGKDQPFYALYSPRLGQWREGTKQRQEIAKKFIEEIRKISPDGPYFIGGYSAGGVIALEIAQQMQQIGSEVDLLVLFDTFGPDPPQRLPWATPWIFNLLLVLRRVESYLWKFRILDWKGKLEYLQIPKIRSWIRDRYWEVNVPQEIDREVDKEPIYFGGSEYSPETYPGKVLLIRAEKGLLGIYPYPDLGWGKIFTGDFEICEVPGDHEAILFGPRARYVAERLNFYLNAAD